MAKIMKIDEILVGTVLGGLFHTEDAIFELEPKDCVLQIDKLLEELSNNGELKNGYRVFIPKPEQKEDKSKLMVGIMCTAESKVKCLVTSEAITYEIGAVIRQNDISNCSGYFGEVVRIVDGIAKLRERNEITNCGIMPKFAIPYTRNIAGKYLKEELFSNFENIFDCKKYSGPLQLVYKMAIECDGFNIDLELGTNDAGNSIRLLCDIRPLEIKGVSSYIDFIHSATTTYDSFTMNLVNKFIRKKFINRNLLLHNED